MKDKLYGVFKKNLIWTIIPVLLVFFLPIVWLGGDVVLEIHDQLDETLFLYKMRAMHLGEAIEIYPEMMSGLYESSISVSAPIMIILYKIFSVRTAFLIQYVIVGAAAYAGMYLCVKYFTDNSIVAVISGGFFVFIPYYPVYGLSVMGFPLLLYAFICLYHKKKLPLAYLIILVYAFSSHLALGGFVSIGVGIISVVVLSIIHKSNRFFNIGIIELVSLYLISNLKLIFNSSFESHRVEFMSNPVPFWDSLKNIFLYSGQHAPSMHIWMILPELILIVAGLVLFWYPRYKMSSYSKKLLWILCGLFMLNIVCAAWAGFVYTEFYINLLSKAPEFIRAFQLSRVYFLLPSAWYISLGVSLAFLYSIMPKRIIAYLVATVVAGVILLKGTGYILDYNANNWMRNIRQVNAIERDHKKLDIITWNQLYAYDLFEEIDKVVDKDKSSYKVASLGICPVSALMNGYYTIDGYSNNYSLEYKKTFRKIIEKELDKSDVERLYFDGWGSRCYIVSADTNNYYVSKSSNQVYSDLELNVEEMKKLGCKYLFSAGEILNADEKGFLQIGVFETEDSYYRIWVYELK